MFKGLPLRFLHASYPSAQRMLKFPNLARVSTKLALGIACATFLLGYQPTLELPFSKTVHAQAEQSRSISAQEVPIEFQLPHPGYVSTKFSTFHKGIDIASGLGMPIKPVAKGTVKEAGYNFLGLGLTVVIEHEHGYQSLYAHMGKIYVKKDQNVNSNDFLGEIGLTGFTTGPHTHLEITRKEQPIDPLTILPKMREEPVAQDFQPVTDKKVSQKPDFSKEIKASL